MAKHSAQLLSSWDSYICTLFQLLTSILQSRRHRILGPILPFGLAVAALFEKSPDLLEQKFKLGWVTLDARQMIKISPLLGLRHVPPLLSGTAEMSMAGGPIHGQRGAGNHESLQTTDKSVLE